MNHIHDQGQIFEINQSIVELFGYDRAELLGQHARILLTPEAWEIAAQHIAEGDEEPYEIRGVRKDGLEFPIEVQAKQVPYQGRQLRVTAVRDITLRKEVEESLQQAKEQAEAANLSKSNFLANMSHEIRNPMNAVLGFTEILKNLEKEPQKIHFLETIQKSGNVLLSLINDILDLSKIEAGKIETQYSPVSIQRLLMEIETVFQQKAQDLGIDLCTEVKEPFQDMLLLDEMRVRQIVFNLVSNAIKFSEQGIISITACICEKNDGTDTTRCSRR